MITPPPRPPAPRRASGAARAMARPASFDSAPDPTAMIGTLRWGADASWPPLPPFPADTPPVLNSWQVYLVMRHRGAAGAAEEDDDAPLQVQPHQLDALSFPLTLAACLRKVQQKYIKGLWAATGEGAPRQTLHCVVAGAAAKTEQRILEETNYWEELGWLFPHLDWELHLVGPELRESVDLRRAVSYCAGCGAAPAAAEGGELLRCSGCRRAWYCSAACQRGDWTRHKTACRDAAPAPPVRLAPNLSARVWRTTLLGWIQAQQPAAAVGGAGKKKGKAAAAPCAINTLVFGCNTGMGSGNEDLMAAWVPDVQAALDNGLLCVHSCANTWGDLRGELLVLEHEHGAKMVMPPSSNPFKAATVVQAEEESETGHRRWYCANHCCYAYQGKRDDDAAARMQTREKVPMLVEAVRRMAPALATYAPSVPMESEDEARRREGRPVPMGGCYPPL